MAKQKATGLDAVFTDGVLMDLDVTYWSGLRRNTAEDLGLEKKNIPGFVVGLGTKRLIPREFTDAWSSFAGKARYLLECKSFRFPVANALFIPARAISEVDAGLLVIKGEFEVSVTRFLAAYDKIRRDTLAAYPDHAESLKHYYPLVEEIKDSFKFEWSAFTVSLPTSGSKVYMEAALSGLEKAALEKYQRDLETKAQTFLDQAVMTLRAETVALASSVSARLASGEVITEKSLNAVRRFVDRFRMMNFVGDREVEQRLTHLGGVLTTGAAEFRSDEAARQALAEALQDVRKAAEKVTDISDVTGTYRRKINLDG